MDKILVLMSTYNGKKYISEQIDSILNQQDVCVDIMFRDDGSSDDTISILEKYKAEYPDRITLVNGKNIGAKKSFLTLIREAPDTYEFYALSDQDDIWKPEKLISGIRRLKKIDDSVPLIYGSPVTLYSDGRVGKIVFNESSQYDLGNFLIKNYFPGCTTIFNYRLKELIQMIDPMQLRKTPLHDHWMNLVCTSCGGKVVMDIDTHIFYRQHGGNVVGGERTIANKIKHNGLFSKANVRLNYTEELYNCYNNQMTDEEKIVVQKVISYKKSFKNRIELAFDRKIKPVKRIERYISFFNVILGTF